LTERVHPRPIRCRRGAVRRLARSPVIQPKTTLPPGAANWNNFRAFFGDVNGDGRIDVVLNDASTVASIYVLIR